MDGRLIINIKAKNNLDYLFKQSPVSEPEGIEVGDKKIEFYLLKYLLLSIHFLKSSYLEPLLEVYCLFLLLIDVDISTESPFLSGKNS